MKPSALLPFILLSISGSATAAPKRLNSFVWQDRVIANFAQVAEVVRELHSVTEADDLMRAAQHRGNQPSTLGWVLDDLAPSEQDKFVSNFKIDHPFLGNHGYARWVSPAYRMELERPVEVGVPAEEVAFLVGYVPELSGFGLTTLREQMSTFDEKSLDPLEAMKWLLQAESKRDGSRGNSAYFRRERFEGDRKSSAPRDRAGDCQPGSPSKKG